MQIREKCKIDGCENLSQRRRGGVRKDGSFKYYYSDLCRRHYLISKGSYSKHLGYKRRWEKSNLQKRRYSSKKATCARRGIPFEMSFEKWQELSKELACFYCGSTLKEGRDRQVDRKSPSLGYTDDNTVAACFECNRLKSNIFTDREWLEVVKRYGLGERYRLILETVH